MRNRRLLHIILAALIAGCNTTQYQSGPVMPETRNNDIAEIDEAIDVAVIETPDEGLPITILPVPASSAAADNSTEAGAITYQDIWERIGRNLHMDRHLQNRSVQDKLSWYKRNQDYLDRVADRARPYIHYIVEEIERRNMPLEIALLPVVESAFQPFAYSSERASGIWQFIPSTGKHYGLKQNWWYDGRRDITAATHAALDYLEKLHKEFNGDWLLALAAYNTGERNVARAIRRNKRNGRKQDFFSLRLPRETRGYVPSLLAVAELVANPAKHNVTWKQVPDLQYFEIVDAGSQLDLALVSSLSGLSMDEVYTLNPAYNRWATDPNGPHTILMPLDKAENFKQKLFALPEEERVSWQRHVIKSGESLGLIAEKYHTDVGTLKRANGIRGNLIQTGHSLLIPTSKQPLKHYTLSMDARRFQGLKKTGDGKKYIYTVRRGDTLWDIGRHYGVSVNRLTSWNGISSRSYLRPGQKLTLWLAEDGEVLTAGNSSDKSSAPRTRTPDDGDYIVKNGDSLWLIANRTGTTVSRLRQLNNLSTNNLLKPGQKLKLAPAEAAVSDAEVKVAGNEDSTEERVQQDLFNYTVRRGDSLWLIARRYGITISNIMKYNNLTNGNYLRPGQVLNLKLTGTGDINSINKKSTAINYTVKRGDSLWLISRRFGITVNQLRSWNNLWNKKHLQPGQKLVLYITEA